MRYAACVEYDGSQFNGWQAQKHDVRTVQQTLEAALSKVANEDIQLITAGRTDAKVHATHQVVHFISDAERDITAWLRGCNRFLPKDVRVQWLVPVSDDFHARFSAQARQYRYVIFNNRVNSAILRQQLTHVYYDLDVEAMQVAGQSLLGEHDFTSFRAAGCQAHSPVRTVSQFKLSHQGDWIWFDIKANAFLQHMVRNIAGCLIAVGSGKYPAAWLGEVLALRDRTKAGVTAPANGLYLVGVDYPSEFALPSQLRQVQYWA